MNDTRNKKDKNQHIQVFVRVRPINNIEKTNKSPVVVDVASNKEIVVRERPQDKLTKKFTFDKVFGPVSKQIDVYNAVVSPLLDEVLAGYNCTVFAYGQTGTGKTFTMEGSCNDPALHWQTDSTEGIIPRSLSHLFNELRTLGAQEYSVRVSFLELYNEELFDLLSPNDDASKIRIYEDASRKGAIIIHGLEEVTVHNKSEVYKILEKGSEKRQTAATLMNAHSSRSHTVFSITVHIKENTVDGEELLKTGKLNLVDLAGSENVGRSGAVDRRAREAGNINQSLLTLGRVITALVERAPHVPYRESKLTRLLQESLGGRTKTSIIATISPANMNIEETLSTLDYAHRAKNITNRPEINQKLSKKALLKEYTEEIERLRRDLLASRERNGIYLAQENYNQMQSLIEMQSKKIEEKINHIKALEETMHNKEKIFTDLKIEYESTTNALYKTKEKLESTKNVLITTQNELSDIAFDRDLNKHLVEKHVTTERVLLNQAQTLLNVAENATMDTQKLHEKINRKKQIEEENEYLGKKFKQEMFHSFKHIQGDLENYTQELVKFCFSLKDQMNSVIACQNNGTDTAIKHISVDLIQQEVEISKKLTEQANNYYDDYHNWILTQIEKASDMTQHEREVLQNISTKISPKIRQLVENKISENLKMLHKETSLKLLNLTHTMKKSIDDFCNTLLIDRDNLTKQIDEIKKYIEISVENENRIVQNENLFSKMFSDLKKQFDHTWQQYEETNTENIRCHSIVSNKLNEIQIKNDQVIENNLNSFNKNVNKKKLIEKEIENCIEIIRNEVSSTLKENWNIAENAVVQSTDVINQLEDNLNASQHTLVSYNNLIKDNAVELQHKTEKDKEVLVTKIQEYHKIISDASTAHTNFMEEQRIAAQNSCSDINYKLENQALGSSEWNNKLNSQLNSTHEKIEKFIVEELRRDNPTGTTPSRKEFNYPRHLIATSPHERIIQRFREVKEVVQASDEDNNTIIDIMSPNMNGEDCNSLSSPPLTKNNHVTSTPHSESKIRIPIIRNNSYSLIKSASTSDIPLVTKAKLDSTAMSESEILKDHDNKENGQKEFIKPDKSMSKQLSRVKSVNRKVLGSYN
ncbi:PREDICTED: bipolar kinesin KRP-130 [Ceratosolen solmsi marchali]|uniref:Bipolar kinesin KRP-130 n=1 Tax=Ceratosolen solmsi marchali TaxID=326594 RepID=A0AAJ7E181_9HYME|nr:PREDICTED: bipolar kinesin KRP-130 [Ceratosolen solmsi marchali]